MSRAHVLSANRPDFRDIMMRQASGVPGIETVGCFGTRGRRVGVEGMMIRHAQMIKGTLSTGIPSLAVTSGWTAELMHYGCF